jgi:hypothetical protein
MNLCFFGLKNYIFLNKLILSVSYFSGPGSSVGIATDYGLDGPWIESRWGRDLSHTIPDRPWGLPSLLGTGSFPGVNRPGRGADHSPLLASRLRMSRAILLLPL